MLVEVQLKDGSFTIIDSNNISSIKASSTTEKKTDKFGDFTGVANTSDENGTFTVSMIGGEKFEINYASFNVIREANLAFKPWDPDRWMWAQNGYGQPMWGPKKVDPSKNEKRRYPYNIAGQYIPTNAPHSK